MNYQYVRWRPATTRTSVRGATIFTSPEKFGYKSKRDWRINADGRRVYEKWAPAPLAYFDAYQSRLSYQIALESPIFPNWEPGVSSTTLSAIQSSAMIDPATGAPSGDLSRAAYARAYNKLWDKLYGDVSELGVSVAEGREAIVAIVERSARLGKAYSALKRGRFLDFLHQLGGRPKEKHKKTKWTRPKDASSLWLEYWLGWAPLVGDIYSSLDVLTSSAFCPPTKISVWSGRERDSFSYRYENWDKSTIEQIYGDPVRVLVGLGLTAQVENPMLYLRERLGANNVAKIAWAVVPFSFVIDWFANIGDILNSMAYYEGRRQFTGLTVKEGWVSSNMLWRGQCNYTYERGVFRRERRGVVTAEVKYARRVVVGSVFPRVPLVVKWPRISASRGATAISLLLSIFTKG